MSTAAHPTPIEDSEGTPKRVALIGDVELRMLEPYFRNAGYETFVPDGFGTWRQALLDDGSALRRFRPDCIFDVTAHEEVLAREVPRFFDPRMRELASMPYSLDGIQALVDECAWALLRGPKKVLAVDADNTLWRGIISEDGMDSVFPYRAFQEALLDLRREGVLLVLLTKNDPFEFRLDMPLDMAAFAGVRTNWAPKAGNLVDVCRELNLGLDSVVFVDDNPYERAQMAAHLPAVTVAPFPHPHGLAMPDQFVRRLREYFFFDMGRTAEDRLRADDYARRAEVEGQYASSSDYLDDLGLWVRPSRACEADLDRLAQMAGKTNQFNATTIRRTREEFARLIAEPDWCVYVFRAGDRFGEQGLVAYVVIDLFEGRATDFVMSCRAMGRTLEHFVLAYVSRALGEMPSLDYVPTAKNRPFAEFRSAVEAGDPLVTHYREET